ncbi:unnamed protein product [Ilex paraguariensis]|uniref:Uncharacterized protein n=1 Tax=Ilex paraguariensis TaxID=185542 RepID=A0ABC8RB57_9AQUA
MRKDDCEKRSSAFERKRKVRESDGVVDDSIKKLKVGKAQTACEGDKKEKRLSASIQPLGFLILVEDKNNNETSSSACNTTNNNGKKEIYTYLKLNNKFGGIIKKQKMRDIKNLKAENLRQARKDEEEERLLGVSLRLKLYEDPWQIKKKLTHNDINNSCYCWQQTWWRQLLPFLKDDIVDRCKTAEGNRMIVYDIDTASEHRLTLKRWCTNSYVITSN